MLKNLLKLLMIFIVAGVLVYGGYWWGSKNPAKPGGEALLDQAKSEGEKIKPPASPVDKLIKDDKDSTGKEKPDKDAEGAQASAKKDSEEGKKEGPDKDKTPDGEKTEPASKDSKNSKSDKPGETSPASPPKPTFPKASKLSYTLLVDSFLVRMDAEDMVNRLRENEEKAYILSVWDSHKQLWHSVQVGHYRDYDSAAKAADKFSVKERLPVKVVELGSLEFIPPEFIAREEPADKPPEKKPKK